MFPPFLSTSLALILVSSSLPPSSFLPLLLPSLFPPSLFPPSLFPPSLPPSSLPFSLLYSYLFHFSYPLRQMQYVVSHTCTLCFRRIIVCMLYICKHTHTHTQTHTHMVNLCTLLRLGSVSSHVELTTLCTCGVSICDQFSVHNIEPSL